MSARREKWVSLRVTETEWAWIAKTAKDDHRTASDWLRFIITAVRNGTLNKLNIYKSDKPDKA